MKQQLIAWLNERIKELRAGQSDNLLDNLADLAERKEIAISEIETVIEYVKGTDNPPQTFDEVLKKHFGDSRVIHNKFHNFSYIKFQHGEAIIRAVYYYDNDEHQADLQSFTSPEKLDQFLTLLFGEEP